MTQVSFIIPAGFLSPRSFFHIPAHLPTYGLYDFSPTMAHMLSRSGGNQLTELPQAFENTSTNVAAAQMRNALTNLAETVEDPNDKKVITIPANMQHCR